MAKVKVQKIGDLAWMAEGPKAGRIRILERWRAEISEVDACLRVSPGFGQSPACTSRSVYSVYLTEYSIEHTIYICWIFYMRCITQNSHTE
jgi:hypothetical protein